jgi:uncharacterized protein YyaL (SSP411 family)
VLLRLAQLTGDETLREKAKRSLESFGTKMKAQPTMAPQMLVALGRWLAAPEHNILRCGDEIDARSRELLDRYARAFSPNTITLALTDAAAKELRPLCPFLGSLERRGEAVFYRCHNFTCELPETVV